MIQSISQAVALLTLHGRSLTILFPLGVPRGRAFKYLCMGWLQDLSPPFLLGPLAGPTRLIPWGSLVVVTLEVAEAVG